jgi:hypothetical protein
MVVAPVDLAAAAGEGRRVDLAAAAAVRGKVDWAVALAEVQPQSQAAQAL